MEFCRFLIYTIKVVGLEIVDDSFLISLRSGNSRYLKVDAASSPASYRDSASKGKVPITLRYMNPKVEPKIT